MFIIVLLYDFWLLNLFRIPILLLLELASRRYSSECLNSDIGMVKENVVPTSGIDLTVISPPSLWTIMFDIVRPRPMPPRLMSEDASSLPKNLKSFY